MPSTTTGTSLINRASVLLLDTSNVRWTRSQLLAWLNDAQRQIVLLKPPCNSIVASMKLSAGARQVLPPDGWILLDVFRNLGTTGATSGPAVRIVSRKLMDTQDLNWYSAVASDVVQHFIYNIDDQNAFYVYPPSTGNNYVEVNYSGVPADLPAEASVISINDIFQTPILDYMLYRACSQDSEQANMQALAQMHLTSFNSFLQGKDEAELQNNVNLDMLPVNSAVRGSA